MSKSHIEKLLAKGKYQQALSDLRNEVSSKWRDTAELKCLRALARAKPALELARQLFSEKLVADDERLKDSASIEQLFQIAKVFIVYGDAQQGRHILHALCICKPNQATLRYEYGNALLIDLNLEGAQEQFLKALKLNPKNAATQSKLALTFCLMGQIEAGLNGYYRAASLNPTNTKYLQRLNYWSNFSAHCTPQSSYQLAKLWAHKALPHQRSSNRDWPNAPLSQVVNIGFVLGDLDYQKTFCLVLPLLQAIDKEKFQVVVYSDSETLNKNHPAISRKMGLWHDSSRYSDTRLITQIRNHEVDVLVDMCGHAKKNRLEVFAKNPAPLQISWLGYPATTGLDSITHRITDRNTDPDQNLDRYFSEKLVRLSGSHICFQPHDKVSDILPREEQPTVVFGALVEWINISDKSIDAWASALLAAPESSLYLQRLVGEPGYSAEVVVAKFKQHGIKPKRITIVETDQAIAKQTNRYQYFNEIDIALDTTPQNDIVATLEALWMGVPVVSLCSDVHAGRRTGSILKQISMEKFATENVQEFAEQTADLAANYPLRKRFRNDLRTKLEQSPLMNNTQFSAEFGAAIWQLWQSQHDPQLNQTPSTADAQDSAVAAN